MSVIGGPNNPISNGLVYALDFKNNRSYVSGSTSARSLLFSPITGSIITSSGVSAPNLVNGLLRLARTSTSAGTSIETNNSSLTQYFTPSSAFTISTVVAPSQSGILFGVGTSNPQMFERVGPAEARLGWNLGGGQYFSRAHSITSSLQHITYRYISGSFDLFVNGTPVSSSAANLSDYYSNSNFIIGGSKPFGSVT
jgi:hypothetical protein